MVSERRRQFGEHLARLRRDAGKSQRQLAEFLCAVSCVRSSVTRNEVSRWERAERIPDSWLPALAEALNVPLDTLERAAAYARGESSGVPFDPAATLAELLPEGDPLAPLTAMTALGKAHDALSEQDDEQAPLWAYWICREELDVMDARVFTELRRPLRAVPLLTDVLSRYDATHALEVALYRSWLAVALMDADEPEQAAAEARRVVARSSGLASDRAAGRARAVLHQLRDCRDVPEVRSLLHDHGHLLSA
ncbi:helix-turn-helix domain-containing protein [Streptomyces halobius]|uniref:Helix-turn-helix domain-containing protein n=1 Tax=Streptomyces halobius TaxID=2879846 RepID=A0ABY4MC81_9ACTN|nr:helix-turn-helix transcriptional regulator [Streptomyces halobius]UQA93926.1 helix-turn-helix domain-containing protein [Streptomyces halobius]